MLPEFHGILQKMPNVVNNIISEILQSFTQSGKFRNPKMDAKLPRFISFFQSYPYCWGFAARTPSAKTWHTTARRRYLNGPFSAAQRSQNKLNSWFLRQISSNNFANCRGIIFGVTVTFFFLRGLKRIRKKGKNRNALPNRKKTYSTLFIVFKMHWLPTIILDSPQSLWFSKNENRLKSRNVLQRFANIWAFLVSSGAKVW